MTRLRIRLPPWTAHPGFGVLVLFVLAVVLIAHGEPQPSSRPSGTSVAVSGTATAPGSVPPLLYLRGDRVEFRQQQRLVREVPLPAGAVPTAIVSGRGLAVVLAAADGRQRAYAVDHSFRVHDLGYADAVLPAVSGTAAIIVETAVLDPGLLPLPSPSASSSGSKGLTSASDSGEGGASSSKANQGLPDLRDFAVRRYDTAGRSVGLLQELPPGTRVATDTAAGLVVWQPVNRVFDAGLPQESLSAAAELIRPDGSERALGPVHPLAANGQDLLVWDVAVRRFGVMPLRYVTSTATSTATPKRSSSTPSVSRSATSSPSARPTTVAGVRWFLPTRGMLLVTGPAAFNSDGTSFAVYAQVGTRRRLVVAELQNLGTDQVQVLSLAQPLAKPSATPSSSATLISPSNGPSSGSPSASSTAPALEPDGYPIAAPLAPLWWNGLVVGVGTDGTVVGYKPGGAQSSLLDLGLTGIKAMASVP
ncbi:MAG: hypothetical protein ABI140_08705 [Jatrophihabitantaceae bacterium]